MPDTTSHGPRLSDLVPGDEVLRYVDPVDDVLTMKRTDRATYPYLLTAQAWSGDAAPYSVVLLADVRGLSAIRDALSAEIDRAREAARPRCPEHPASSFPELVGERFWCVDGRHYVSAERTQGGDAR